MLARGESRCFCVTLRTCGAASRVACVLRTHNVSLPAWLEKQIFSLFLQRASFFSQVALLVAEVNVLVCRVQQQSSNTGYARPLFFGLPEH